MANYGFGITAAQINKLLSGEWSDEVRLQCYMAAAIADLPDAKAYAKFVFLLNSLGIKLASTTKITKEQYVETFAYGGKVANALTEADMQKRIAKIFWPDQDADQTYLMLAGVTGKALTDLYTEKCVKKATDVTFVLHRIVVGQNTVYRICPDSVDVKSITAEAVRYLTPKA